MDTRVRQFASNFRVFAVEHFMQIKHLRSFFRLFLEIFVMARFLKNYIY